jgi:transcriptional regulator with XRE-family HTH domain
MKLEEVIARSVSELRHQREWTQSDLAHRMKAAGTNWTANRVAQIETLRGKVTLYDVMALTWVFEVPLDRLLAGEDFVDFPNETGFLPLANVRSFLAEGKPSPDARPPGQEPKTVAVKASTAVGVTATAKVEVHQPAVKVENGGLVFREGDDEEIRKIAKKLDLTPAVLQFICRRKWRHGFIVERDMRAGDLTGLSKRSAQTKRGHVTRALSAELAADIERDGMDKILADYAAYQKRRRDEMAAQLADSVGQTNILSGLTSQLDSLNLGATTALSRAILNLPDVSALLNLPDVSALLGPSPSTAAIAASISNLDLPFNKILAEEAARRNRLAADMFAPARKALEQAHGNAFGSLHEALQQAQGNMFRPVHQALQANAAKFFGDATAGWAEQVTETLRDLVREGKITLAEIKEDEEFLAMSEDEQQEYLEYFGFDQAPEQLEADAAEEQPPTDTENEG